MKARNQWIEWKRTNEWKLRTNEWMLRTMGNETKEPMNES